MSDLPKVKIYEMKSRIKNHRLPKTRVKDKTIMVSKITKMNCPELLTVTSSFLDFHSFRKRERERERVNSLQGSLLIPNFSNLSCCPLNCLA